MANVSMGDMAQSFQLRRDTAQVRDDLMRATQELSTGVRADLGKAVKGDYGPVLAIDRQLSALSAYKTTATEAALFADTAQLALERVQSLGIELAPQLIGADLGGYDALEGVVAADAKAAFITTVEMFNSQTGGRGIFGGTATNRAALGDPQTMLSQLRDELEAKDAKTAVDVERVVADWFKDAEGFKKLGYLGSDDPLTGFRVGEGTTVEVGIKADDATVVEQLKGLAMVALLAEGALEGNAAQQVELAKIAGTTILGNQTAFSALRADLGTAQARIEQASARNSSETSALQIARSDIVSADPYGTATELQNLEVQLETIYTLTARLSRLSLTDYLR